jgi:hypothetical protein
MAKKPRPKRVSTRTPAPTDPFAVRGHSFTPELLASGRRRYEQTDETITSLAIDFGVHRITFQRLADRAGWVRHVRVPLDLPVAAKLLGEAEALEASTLPCSGLLSLPPPERGRSPAEAAGEGGRVGVNSSAEATPHPRPLPTRACARARASAAREGRGGHPRAPACRRAGGACRGRNHALSDENAAATSAGRRAHRAHAREPHRNLAQTATAAMRHAATRTAR